MPLEIYACITLINLSYIIKIYIILIHFHELLLVKEDVMTVVYFCGRQHVQQETL